MLYAQNHLDIWNAMIANNRVTTAQRVCSLPFFFLSVTNGRNFVTIFSERKNRFTFNRWPSLGACIATLLWNGQSEYSFRHLWTNIVSLNSPKVFFLLPKIKYLRYLCMSGVSCLLVNRKWFGILLISIQNSMWSMVNGRQPIAIRH